MEIKVTPLLTCLDRLVYTIEIRLTKYQYSYNDLNWTRAIRITSLSNQTMKDILLGNDFSTTTEKGMSIRLSKKYCRIQLSDISCRYSRKEFIHSLNKALEKNEFAEQYEELVRQSNEEDPLVPLSLNVKG